MVGEQRRDKAISGELHSFLFMYDYYVEPRKTLRSRRGIGHRKKEGQFDVLLWRLFFTHLYIIADFMVLTPKL